MSVADLLLEIGTEELPAKSLQTLSHALASNLEKGLRKAEITHKTIRTFATPRRLAVIIHDIETHQQSRTVEKRGPALKAAFDAEGHPTLACIGFANACNTTVDQLIVRETEKGAWLFYNQIEGGIATADTLPALIRQAIQQLPIAKPMRWGNGETEFIRPVHWVVLLFGEEVIKTELLGVTTGRHTAGHRFQHPQPIAIPHPSMYEQLLSEQGHVIADFATRKQYIWSAVQKVIPPNTIVEPDEELLDEITGLVEWPVALLGKFEDKFLEVPAEAITTAMKSHQRYFPVKKQQGELLPYFVLTSNIKSPNPKQIIIGNQRVIRARLADAQFFYHTDLQRVLESYLEDLKHIVFQKELGTLFDKSARIAKLMVFLAQKINFQPTQLAERTGLLCKTDLATTMVGEFPELQGTMGYYYAMHSNEPTEIASALYEGYLPRFAGDKLPHTPLGQLLAIADKIDTLVGFFGINQIPTGEKDPYGLKRAALGVLRILVEGSLPLNLLSIIVESKQLYQERFINQTLDSQLLEFMMERLRAWYLDQSIDPFVFVSLWDLEERDEARASEPLDFHRRIFAVQNFLMLPQAHALIAANKRVKNILKGLNNQSAININLALLELPAEKILFDAMRKKADEIAPLIATAKYTETLTSLANLQKPVDDFFDNVMVMVDNEALKNNRLNLLRQLQHLFLQVADISKLVVPVILEN